MKVEYKVCLKSIELFNINKKKKILFWDVDTELFSSSENSLQGLFWGLPSAALLHFL